MIDTVTYGLTKDLPGGPIYRNAEPMPHELLGAEDGTEDVEEVSLGRLIGGGISLVLLVATGAYLFLAI